MQEKNENVFKSLKIMEDSFYQSLSYAQRISALIHRLWTGCYNIVTK